MLDYQKNYEKQLMSRNISKSALKNKKISFNKFENYLEVNSISHNFTEWDQLVFEGFYKYLKLYSYKIADNKKTGYLKDRTKRKYVKKKLVKEVIQRHMTDLKYYIYFLLESGRIYLNPFEKIKIKQSNSPKSGYNVTETHINKLVKNINTDTYLGYRDRTMIELIYGTGIRVSEASKLDIYDIDFNDKVAIVRMGKGSKDRIIPIGEVALSYVKEYLTEVRKYIVSVDNLNEKAMFLSTRGKRLCGDDIGRIVRNHARNNNLNNITTHKLRHAFSLHMLRKGCDIRYIQEMLGHEDLSTTAVYTEVYDSDLKEKILKHHPRDKAMKGRVNKKSIIKICKIGNKK